MDAKQEARILRDVLRQTEEPDLAVAQQGRVKRMVYGAGNLGLLAALLLAIGDYGPAWAAVLLGGAAGIGIGVALMHEQVLKQWPVTARYVDRERVRARLEALDAGLG